MRKKATLTDNAAMNRRTALSRLGLTVSAMYVAPALLTLSDAAAKGGSGGGGSGGGGGGSGGHGGGSGGHGGGSGASGHGGASHGGASHGGASHGGPSHGPDHASGATSPSGPSSDRSSSSFGSQNA
jgi:hypothetical protein